MITVVNFRDRKPLHQHLYCLGLVILATLIFKWGQDLVSYRFTGFSLLLLVTLLAISFDIIPVFTAAVAAAAIWDYFFVPPVHSFEVHSSGDAILLSMFFLIALVNSVLTYQIRQVEKSALKKEEKANAVQLYDTLLNALSHEMRTPISAIISASELLQTHQPALSGKEKEDLLDEISKAALRLNRQVQNLLNMSRIDSGVIRPRFDWLDITELVYEVVRRIEEGRIAQTIHISIKPNLPLFWLDKNLMEQILYNLLHNAVRYTPPGSRIHISAMDHGNILQLVVEDNGPGFPPDEIEDVFDKFYRLKNTQVSGTGLGLSIVRGFTAAMGGTVSLQNLPGGGARFTLDIASKTTFAP